MSQADVKRKLAAILAADVAGYSRLMGDDERATIATLREFREVFRERIEANGGRVVDMAGDSVLAIFDSAAGAVQAANETQADLATRNEGLPETRRMLFRIGVNLGDIEEADDGTVYGDGVNVAARLEAMADPGGINVSGSVFDSVRGKLDLRFDFLGEHEVKNIAEPVRAYRVLGADEAPARWRGLRSRRARMTVGFVAAVLLVAIAVGVWWSQSDQAGPAEFVVALPDGPAIVVIPFENMSGDIEQDLFARGLSKEIVSALSRFKELFVFDLEAARHLQGEGKSPGEIGDTLGARYVLNGGVERMHDSLRVSVSLTTSADDATIWAENYDRDLTVDNFFDIQDDIAANVAGRLVGAASVTTLDALQEARRKRPENLTDYDCILLERAYWELYTEDWHLKARGCLERVVVDNPTYAPAWISLSWMISEEYTTEYNIKEGSMDRALKAARQAVNLDPMDGLAYDALASMHYLRGEYDDFLIAAERAVELNTNNVEILSTIGLRYTQHGMLDRGEALLQRARRLNPYPPSWIYFGDFWIALGRGDHEAALEAAQKLDIEGFFWVQGALAMAYANLGRDEEARAAIAAMKALAPDFTAEDFAENLRIYASSDRLHGLAMDALYRAGLTPADVTD